jgi:hypothetical protein
MLNALFLLNSKNMKNFSLSEWIKMSPHPVGKRVFSPVENRTWLDHLRSFPKQARSSEINCDQVFGTKSDGALATVREEALKKPLRTVG